MDPEQLELWNEMDAIAEIWTPEDLQAYNDWVDTMEQEYLYQQQHALEGTK